MILTSMQAEMIDITTGGPVKFANLQTQKNLKIYVS